MPWVKLDDGFAEHPKMEAAGPLGLALHVAALCYCSRHLTDGFVPASKVPRLLALPSWRKVAASLVAVGAWIEVDGGYELHDYLEFQPSADIVKAERTRKSVGGAEGNHRRWHKGKGKTPNPECRFCIAEGIAPPIGSATTVRVPPSRPVPSLTSDDLHYSRAQTLRAVENPCTDCLGSGWVVRADDGMAVHCHCRSEAAS